MFNVLRPYLFFLLAGLFLLFEMGLQVSVSIINRQLMQYLHITALGLGIVSSIYYYSYTAMQIPAGFIFDRFRAKRMIVVNLLICVAGTALFASAHSVFVAALGRFITGLGSASAFIAVLYVAAQWFPAKRFALLAGITMILASLGAILGQGPLSLLIDRLGWREALVILCVAGTVLAVLIALIMQDKPKKPIHRQADAPANRFAADFVRVFKNKQTWVIALYAFMIWAPITGFASLWGVSFIGTAYNISITAAGFATSVIWIGIACGSPVFGWLSDTFNRRREPLLAVAGIGLLAGIAVIYLHLSLPLLYLGLFLFGVGAAGQALSFAAVKDNNPPQVVATAVGVNNMAVVASGFVFQPLIGWLLAAGHGGALNLSQQSQGGIPHHGVPVYSLSDYHIALAVIPACHVICILVTLFGMHRKRSDTLPSPYNKR